MTYRFKKINDNKWGIYLKDDLLATIGNYQLWNSVKELFNSRVLNKSN